MPRFPLPDAAGHARLGAAGVVAACGGPGATAAPATPLPSGVIAVEAKDYLFCALLDHPCRPAR